ncbi:hypothetical protein JKP88DRAFT_278729 [Tribonema minus]|uniref:Uncharacterized protein n=1 Tax=Tribonema minus TaxID=303371 RepID=A0A835YUU8_9STRA|nr:hypothetical protein JKP88DRAFT_278729 [Tribonema minus]
MAASHVPPTTNGSVLPEKLNALLKRKVIQNKLDTLCLLSSIAVDVDLIFDWLFFVTKVQEEFKTASLVFAIVGSFCEELASLPESFGNLTAVERSVVL